MIKALLRSLLMTAFASTVVGPSDPLFSLQWNLHNTGDQQIQIDIDQTHTLTQSGKAGIDIGWLEARAEIQKLAKAPVTVAVIDYGVDLKHPDLQGRIADGGWDFITNHALITDPQGHGTHVSGIIAANADNNLGTSGITPPTVQILPLKVLSPDFSSFVLKDTTKSLADFVADAVDYAVAHHVDVINMSLGWPQLIDSDRSRASIDAALKNNIVIVVAAGNDHKDKPTYPCSQDGVLCVGAISNNGAPSYYSNFGGGVHVLAPGDDIPSTIPTAVDSTTLGIQGYDDLTGTSQASPHVAALAAILKSINPKMTANEIKARIMASAAPTPSLGTSLYGLINLSKAIHAQPQPVYLPSFANSEAVTVDEATLTAKGSVHIQNLWATAQNFKASIQVNDVMGGQTQAATFAGLGQGIDIPWSYQFPSLQSSAILTLQITVSDSTQTRKFLTQVTVSRSVLQIPSAQTLKFPSSVKAADVMGRNIVGKVVSRLLSVATIGDAAYHAADGRPIYYKTVSTTDSSITLQFFDTRDLSTSKTITVPFVSSVAHVLRADLKARGEMDYVIISIMQDASKKRFMQFYYLDPSLNPLFGNNSAWQVYPENEAQGRGLSKNYEDINSWIRSTHGILLPAFLANTTLPKLDNFSSLDARSLATTNHLFYLSPSKWTFNDSKPTPVPLEVHSVDTKDFFAQYPKLYIVNPLPQSEANLHTGHLRLLMADDTNFKAHVYQLDVTDESHYKVSPLPSWNFLSATGQAIAAPPGSTPGVIGAADSMIYLKFYDDRRGGLNWSDANGKLSSLTEFAFPQGADAIRGLISAYDIPRFGKFWILDSQFNFIGYWQDPSGKLLFQTFPLERETSNFMDSQFRELFNPILLGSSNQPRPGLFIDSTLVRGNLISALLWNSVTQKFEKNLEFALNIPKNCLNLSPIHMTSDPGSFSVPFLCQEADGGASLRILPLQKNRFYQ